MSLKKLIKMSFLAKNSMVLAAVLALALSQYAYAIPSQQWDYVFTGGNLPDPTVWVTAATSNIAPIPVQGSGLAIVDPDNVNSLLYFHPTLFLGGSANANSTASFRAQVRTPAIDNLSPAWVNNAIGWRLFLDDGVHRAELLLGREANGVRHVRFASSPTSQPILFAWDNDLPNTYEISRLSNGNFVVTLTSADPMGPATPPATFGASAVAPSVGSPGFGWGMALTGAGTSIWQSVHAEVTAVPVPEPSTLLLLGSGIAGLAVLRKRFKG